MGIEPTDPAVNARSSGFEDRGRHQAYRHFRIELICQVGCRRTFDFCANQLQVTVF